MLELLVRYEADVTAVTLDGRTPPGKQLTIYGRVVSVKHARS